MAQIIAVANQKGGVGKSAVTLLAATALAQPPFNYRVAIIDTDPQQSIGKLRAYDLEAAPDAVPPYDVLTLDWPTFRQQVRELDARYQLIFLDVPGKLDTDQGRTSEAVQALQYIDLALVPFTPGNFALDATLDYLRTALAVQQQRPDLRLVAFRNMHRERSRHARALDAELAAVADFVPVMDEALRRYSEFEDADSLASLYSADSSSPARVNFSAWVQELDTLLAHHTHQ